MARTIRLKNNELAAYKWNGSVNFEKAVKSCAKLLKISEERAKHKLHSENVMIGVPKHFRKDIEGRLRCYHRNKLKKNIDPDEMQFLNNPKKFGYDWW